MTLTYAAAIDDPVPQAPLACFRSEGGNKNAFKHGRYTVEAIANRRKIAALLRSMKALATNQD